jgi:hypothetical protein
MRLRILARRIANLARALGGAACALTLFAAFTAQALAVGGHVHQDWRIATTAATVASVHPAPDDCGDPLRVGHAQCAICRVLAMGMAGASAPSAIIAPVAAFITLKTTHEARPFAAARRALGFRSRAPPV